MSAVILGALHNSAPAQEFRTAALTPGKQLSREADPPHVLSLADADRYRRIFVLQEKRDWAGADRESAALADKLLLGHVLAQRYLDPRERPGYYQLTDWLALYADEPDARAIYALALARRPAHAPPPPKPVLPLAPASDPGEIGPQPLPAEQENHAATNPHAEMLAHQIRTLARDDPRKAELVLAGPAAKQFLDETTRAELSTVIAEAYFAAGQAQQALVMSAASEDGLYAPVAHWEAGLAAWRLDRLAEARQHFETLARTPGQSGWTRSAAAFWAARVALRSKRPEFVAYWLGIAAEQPRTFYGLVARRLLGVDTYLDFDTDPFTELDAHMVVGVDGGRRAVALLEAGQTARAEAELRALALRGTPSLLHALAAFADRANLPRLSLQLAGALASADGRYHDHALYPVPRWTPYDGFTVDRALLFALMRQESVFTPQVKSNAGALGLMQLMPETAREVAGKAGLVLSDSGKRAEERRALADPELNLTLAQDYVRSLLADERIKGNLLLFALAYNGGPTAAQRWRTQCADDQGDPLLFLESVPAQVRVFAEHVLTNYWIYRQRLGQKTPDLDALAAGGWPTYIALDTPAEPVGRYAENR